jgi:DUF1680 family protein
MARTWTIEGAPEAPTSLYLRIPGWAQGARVRVNGRKAWGKPEPGAYAELHRAWSAGDRIELDLPMEVRLVVAHPKVEEARNQAAVMRGPVVYCLEDVDLPTDVDLSQVHIPRSIRWTPHHDADLLGGITLLKGIARRIPPPPDNDGLYRTLGNPAIEPLPITLIPYYAWANRGVAKMSVWLPLC